MKASPDVGFYFLPQLAYRVAVDAREQRAITPFQLRRVRRKPSADGYTFGGERGQRRFDFARGDTERPNEIVERDRP